MAESKDYRQILTDRLIEQLESGTAPWQKPWDAKAGIRKLPYNPTSGKDYRGANSLMLSMYGRSDPRWCTYKQADAQGWQVRKGEKGAQVEYWKFHDEKQAVDEKGKPRFNEDGTPVMVSYQLERPQVFRAVVFNAEQMDNVPELAKGPRLYEWDPMERAEQILQSSQAAIFHDQNDRAYYTPARDEIHMPGRDQFASPQAYYSTAMHELGHWTGHESRLGRDLTGGFGSSDYAKEELRAELASYFLADKLGIPHEAGGLDQHAAYVKSWVKALKDDKNEIFRASRDAEQITEYVLQLDRDRSKEVGLERGDVARELAIENTAITEGLRAVAAGQGRDGLDAATEKAFSNVLPAAWNGNMQVVGVVEVEIGGKTHVEWAVNMPEGTQPQFYGVYAQLEGGMHAWIADRPDLAEANKLAHRLTSIHETALPDPERKPGVAVIVPPEPEKELAKERTALVVPYREKEAAKALGAKWDKEAKSWYAPEGTDLKPLTQWIPAKEQVKAPELPAQPKAAHELTFAEFAKDVHAEKLVMHGRDWQVIHAGKDLGFADGETAQEAIARAHEREVNNALWGNSQDAPWASDPAHTAMGQKPTMPPAHVLAEYPHLVEKFAEVVKGAPALTQDLAAPNLDAPTPAAGERTYLAVPFKEKNQAREAGAKWDKEAKVWYAEPGVDLAPLAKWMPDQQEQAVPKAITPVVPQERSADMIAIEGAQQLVQAKSMLLNASYSDDAQSRASERNQAQELETGAYDKLALVSADKARAFVAEEQAKETRDMQLQSSIRFDEPQYEAAIARKGLEQPQPESVREVASAPVSQEKTYLAVPFKEKEQARAAGAKWDKEAKAWYAEPGVDLAPLAKWMPDQQEQAVPKAITPVVPQERSADMIAIEGAQQLVQAKSMLLNASYSDDAQSRASERNQAQELETGAYDKLALVSADKARAFVAEEQAKETRDMQLQSSIRFDEPQYEAAIARKGLEQPQPESVREVASAPVSQEKTYLAVPFKEKEQARAAGAKWDKEAKAWYAEPGADMTALQKWVPSKDMGQGPSLNPEEEFAKAIRATGLDLVDKSGNPTMPIMDGKLQRIPVAGGKKGNRDGAYVGYLDGRPAGFIQNFSSGEEVKWKLDGPEMSPADRARLAAEAAVKKEQRAQELGVQHEEAAGKALARWDRAAEMKPGETTPYLDRKQVEALGVRRSGNDMLVPVRDVDGKLWAVQTVFPEKRELEPGTDPLDKVFTKGAKKEGNFHLIGEVRPGEPIVTLEGYATGASVHMATGYTVAVAFDSGNLDAVVGSLKERYPTNPHFIGADDDRFAKPGRVHKNAGLNKAIDAANKHGVGVIVPSFAEGSRGTDFNDMHVEQGLGAVTAAVDQAISRTMEQSRQQAVELAQQRVGQGAAVASPGTNTRHTGEVVGVDSYHATQVAGKAAVVHQVKDLDKLPAAGQTATIQYSEGKGKVTDRNVEKERQTQLQR